MSSNKTRLVFSAKFHKGSTHWVNVVIHNTRSAMRCCLTKRGHRSNFTDAACWQANKPGTDHCIAEIHLARNYLTLDNIAHESAHAAYHRTVLIGMPLDDPKFQEWVASDTGVLTDVIVAFCDKNRVPIRYATVPTRRLI